MTDRLYDLLQAGDWKTMIALCREWYRTNCPRYDRREVEANLGWVSRMLIVKDQLARRVLLPERDKFGFVDTFRLTPEQADRDLRSEIANHWENEAGTYARHCRAIDEHPMAETAVAETVKRIATRKKQGVSP